jgi:putative transposase
LIWADKAYRGTFVEQAHDLDIDVEIVSDEQPGFHIQKRRWVVERTFAWLHNYRRLSKDYEELIESSEAAIYATMTHLMVRRLARLKSA